MTDRLRIGRPLHRLLPGKLQILHGAWVVPPACKVHGQLCRYGACLGAMAYLQSCSNALVETDPPRCRDPAIKHLLIQRMDEAIAACYRAVWPGLFPARAQELLPPSQGGTPIIHALRLLCQPRCHSGRRERHPGHARRLYSALQMN